MGFCWKYSKTTFYFSDISYGFSCQLDTMSSGMPPCLCSIATAATLIEKVITYIRLPFTSVFLMLFLFFYRFIRHGPFLHRARSPTKKPY